MAFSDANKCKWRQAEAWLEENKNWSSDENLSSVGAAPDTKFMLGVFELGENGEMVPVNGVLVTHKANIIRRLQKYCRLKGVLYSSFNWQYASPDLHHFPHEQDTPESLGMPPDGCLVISRIPWSVFNKMLASEQSLPDVLVKMPRAKNHAVSARPYPRAPACAAHASASARASAVCGTPTCSAAWRV